MSESTWRIPVPGGHVQFVSPLWLCTLCNERFLPGQVRKHAATHETAEVRPVVDCTRCGKPLDSPGFRTCSDCRAAGAARVAVHRDRTQAGARPAVDSGYVWAIRDFSGNFLACITDPDGVLSADDLTADFPQWPAVRYVVQLR